VGGGGRRKGKMCNKYPFSSTIRMTLNVDLNSHRYPYLERKEKGKGFAKKGE